MDTAATSRVRAYSQLKQALTHGSIRCGVIGLGFIGSVLMDSLAEAGIGACGYDRSEGAVQRFRRVRSSAVSCGTEPVALSKCNVLFIAVRNPVRSSTIDEEPLQAAERMVSAHPMRPLLVILESTVEPGVTRRFARAIASEADDIFVAHAPERLSAGQNHESLRALSHLVGGVDELATRLAEHMLSKICDHVVCVSSPEVSELSKLLENAFLSVNIALSGEITRLSSALEISAHEVCKAASTKSHGFMPFYPGAGLGGHCLPNDLFLLAQAARNRGFEPELLNGAIAANERSPELVVNKVHALLLETGVRLRSARLLLVGVGFKVGSADTAHSPAEKVAELLFKQGASVEYVDSLVKSFAVAETIVPRVRNARLPERRFDAGIILSGDAEVDDTTLLECCSIVLDAGGSRTHGPSCAAIKML